jgi:CelD/BcsL family acetyltransferase involved in cellulose biosynthesis
VLCLTDVRPESVLVKDPPASSVDKDFRIVYAADHMNWAIDLSMGKEKYFASRSRKMLKDLRAKRRHAVDTYGPIRLVRIHGNADIERYFALYQEYSRQAFQGRKKRSNFEDSRYVNFFCEFLTRMDERNRLDAHVLLAGEEVLAISFGYRFGSGFNWVLTGFNYECRYVQPGYLLIEELINEVLARGETYYNCYGYESFYKERWCNHMQPLYRVFLIKKSFAGVNYDLLRKAELALRSTPWAIELVRKIKRPSSAQ